MAQASKQAGQRPFRALIYCRISNDPRGKRYGVERQEQDARALVAANDWQLVHAPFCDNDISAARLDGVGKERPAYAAMLELLHAGEADVVVAFAHHRIWRDVGELTVLLNEVKGWRGARRAHLAFGDGDHQRLFDLTDEHDRHALVAMVNEAELSVNTTATLISRQKRQRREQGMPPSGVGFGWLAKRDADGLLVPDPKTAPIVRELYQRAIAGDTLTNMARDLNRRKVQPLRSKRGWDAYRVRQLLQATSNAGLVSYCDRITGKVEILGEGKWQGIVDRDTWEQAQQALEVRNAARGTSRNPRRMTLLTGLVFCDRCGCPMTRKYQPGRRDKDGTREIKTLLRCAAGPGRDNCGRMNIRAQAVEDTVATFLFDATRNDRALRKLMRTNTKDASADAMRELAAIERKIAHHLELVATGQADLLDVTPLNRELRAEAEQLRRQIAVSAPRSAGVDTFFAKPGVIERSWPDLDTDARRAVLLRLFDLAPFRVVVQAHDRSKGSSRYGVDYARIRIQAVV
jgi:DNA invertase Pin-like site-specific DNA recombinase